MPSDLQSKLLAGLFENIDPENRLTIFDIASATPETLAFFSRFKCRLHFADLLAEPLPQREDEEEEVFAKTLREHFSRIIALPADTQLDICLFWDNLNYLDKHSLQAFAEALQPYLHSGSRGHGFGVINSRTVLENQQYAIRDENTLSSKPRQEPQLPYYPHPQRELNEALSGMAIQRGILMADGRLEILLEAT